MRNLLTTLAILILLSGCASLTDTERLIDREPPAGYERLEDVEAELQSWNWFFRKSGSELAGELEQIAGEKASELYGPEAVVKIEALNSTWNPKSLLMLFNLIGFVEDAEIRASVWLPEIPAPEPEPDPEYGIRYRVIPAENYSSPGGFMDVVYKTRAQLEEELNESFAEGEFSEEDYSRKKSRLPGAGRIFVTLGREDITNAISRWFTFTCTYNGKTIFRKRGTEDIPYVYGTDKLWWNDKSFDLDTDWDNELNLEIADSYQNRIYYFRIVRERYIIEE